MPRYLHRLYAAARGYFWTACPVCGAHFGAHEWKPDRLPTATIPAGPSRTDTAICPACTAAGYGYR